MCSDTDFSESAKAYQAPYAKRMRAIDCEFFVFSWATILYECAWGTILWYTLNPKPYTILCEKPKPYTILYKRSRNPKL